MHLTTVGYSKECSFVSMVMWSFVSMVMWSFVSMVMWSWGEAVEYVLVMTLYIPSSTLSDDVGYTQ